MKWYVGTIDAVYENGHAKIVYDDPDEWTEETPPRLRAEDPPTDHEDQARTINMRVAPRPASHDLADSSDEEGQE